MTINSRRSGQITRFGKYEPTDYYYLHENGDLIHKAKTVVEADPSYFDSPFVVRVWGISTEFRAHAWFLCVEALALGANKERVMELKKLWGLTDEDGMTFAENMKPLVLTRSENQWHVYDGEHRSLKFGKGDSVLEAFAEFAKGGDI
jgi:hypothetical protein